jgi:FecR protein
VVAVPGLPFDLPASLFTPNALANDSAQKPDPSSTPSPVALATQIVRLSYVQGAVKVSTGLNGTPDLGKDWILAVVNFPIAEGATLATEDGRAEVEFENGSMIYLAEHSVLQFRQLRASRTGTSTKVKLVVGRATFALESNGHNEFSVKASDALLRLNSAKVFRVESALDGAVFRVTEGSFNFSAVPPMKAFTVGPGEVFECANGMLSPAPNRQDAPDQKAWDLWVNEEQTARKSDIETALKESGLAAPIPGLVDLTRSGTFSDCEPDGKCWEPNQPEAQDGAAAAPAPLPQNPPAAGNLANDCDPTANPGVRCVWEKQDFGAIATYEGPCGRGPIAEKHFWADQFVRYSPQSPKGQVLRSDMHIDFWGNSYPLASAAYPGWWRFPWATCHAGSWIPVEHPERFGCKAEKGVKPGKCPPPKRWVVGPKKKSGSFLRVRLGRTEGFIPKHPLDTRGKAPLNVEDGVLIFHGKGTQEEGETKTPPKTLQIVSSQPSGYETSWIKTLPKAEQPVIEGRLFNSRAQLANQSIRFDYKTRNFVASTEGAGGKTHTVVIAHVGVNGARGVSSGAARVNSTQSGGSHGSSSAGARGASESRNSTSSRSSSTASSRGYSQTYSAPSAGEIRASSPAPAAPASTAKH